MSEKNLVSKKNIILKIIGVILFLILLKVWHLSVVQKEEKLKESKRPQTKTLLVHANRGEIFDRFSLPLAINRIKYNACIYYAQIKQIPSVKWIKQPSGDKTKIYPRKEHIKNLSLLLAKELDMDAERIEDLIHSKASLLPHVPFVIKENISEKDYFKIRMLERNNPGLHAEIVAERYYPQSSTASEILGYMGTIAHEKYLSIAHEIKSLEALLRKERNRENPDLPIKYSSFEEAKNRLDALKELSYGVNDLVGKAGLESFIDERLRGKHGKKVFAIDINGNFLKELPSSTKTINGEKIISSISSELQSFAENLLAQDEKQREGKSTKYFKQNKTLKQLKQPFIKGGAIIVMDPNNGEVLTLASYPNMDPNDFISTSNNKLHKKKQKNILKWLEHPNYIATIFDGKKPLCRTLYDEKKGIYQEKKYLSFEYFLKQLIPEESEIFQVLEKIKNIKTAIEIEENFETLLYYSNSEAHKVIDSIFQENDNHILTEARLSSLEKSTILSNLSLQRIITDKSIDNLNFFFKKLKNNKDKLLVLDLLKMMIFNPSFSDDLIEKIGHLTLSEYWQMTKAILIIEEKLKNIIQPIFSKEVFKKWREENQKDFLKQKREEEKEKKRYPKPYIDYLDQMESFLFTEFWSQQKHLFITSFLKEDKLADNSLSIYLDALSLQKKELSSSSNPTKKWIRSYEYLKNNFSFLDFDQFFNLIKTVRSFQELERPLYGKYPSLIIDKENKEKKLAASFYPQNGFGYTRSLAYRHSTPIGSIFKICVAYSALKKQYEHLVHQGKTFEILNPFTMTDEIKWEKAKKSSSLIVGYSEENKPYPRYYKGGRLPKSSHPNIGKIDLILALAQSSNPYFSILAGDYIDTPEELIRDTKNFSFGSKTKIDLPGEIEGFVPNDLSTNKTGLYSFAIGQHSLITTPLQTAVMLCTLANGGKVLKPEIIKGKKEILKEIFLPQSVRNTILEGLDQTVWGEKGGARASVIKKFKYNQEGKESYNKLAHKMIGKTSTAEIMDKPYLVSYEAEKYNHIWFGCIYYEEEKNWNKPEIVVVVYLKYGDAGKEAAPIASEIIHKYLELKNRHQKNLN